MQEMQKVTKAIKTFQVAFFSHKFDWKLPTKTDPDTQSCYNILMVTKKMCVFMCEQDCRNKKIVDYKIFNFFTKTKLKL